MKLKWNNSASIDSFQVGNEILCFYDCWYHGDFELSKLKSFVCCGGKNVKTYCLEDYLGI